MKWTLDKINESHAHSAYDTFFFGLLLRRCFGLLNWLFVLPWGRWPSVVVILFVWPVVPLFLFMWPTLHGRIWHLFLICLPLPVSSIWYDRPLSRLPIIMPLLDHALVLGSWTTTWRPTSNWSSSTADLSWCFFLDSRLIPHDLCVGLTSHLLLCCRPLKPRAWQYVVYTLKTTVQGTIHQI